MRALWEHLYGDLGGVLGLFSGVRAEPESKRLEDTRSAYFEYPQRAGDAKRLCSRWSFEGREVYFCAHLLTGRRRIKENAAPLLSLYVDGDGAKPGHDVPAPTAVVESSPGREQFHFRLTEPVCPQIGEHLNRRLALAMGADDSGWDLTQLLRPPATRNYKYPDAPAVRPVEINDLAHDPHELDRILPPKPDDRLRNDDRVNRPADVGRSPDPSRLSPRMQDLIRYGNRGDYRSRSEADLAVCVAMFGAGYTEAEVWAVMIDPANGISSKYLEKGRHGERYLSLTIGKAKVLAQPGVPPQRRRMYARRREVISVG
jgi:hypothetical protein